jgi:hypothetical protein
VPSEVLEDFISSRKITCETTFDNVKELANQIQEEGDADLAYDVLCECAQPRT